ncbi:MAG TPA: hypothetical protein VN181_15810, partial [Thermoanaerobaculia bacterium]|nr:hypothetical protein [Thermoanaerobaculia bacterium]
AAAGVYYGPIPLRAVSNALQRNGVTYRVAQVNAAFPGAPLFPNVFAVFPTNVVTNITTIDPHMQSSRSDQATLQYERQWRAATSVSVAYEHLRGRDIIMSRKLGGPTNTQFQSIGDSWYDGMTLAVARRGFRLSYTYSHGVDTSGNFFFSQPQNANDIRAERGRSDNDQRHRLSLSGSTALRGWKLSYIFAYASALPFNIQLPNDRNGDTTFNDRPEGVGRNTGEGFDSQTLDLRVSRVFRVAGRATLEAIVDAFNVFDRANRQVPSNIITSPTFGQATAVGDPRQVQVGLRIGF